MEQEKLVLLIAILLFINLVLSGWMFARSMMRPLEKLEGYGGCKGNTHCTDIKDMRK